MSLQPLAPSSSMELLLGVYAVWLVIVVRRLLIKQLPQPSDVVILSLFFYNVPLSVLAIAEGLEVFGEFAVFLNAVASDAEVASRTLLATMLASVCVSAGAGLGRLAVNGSRTELVVPVGISLQVAAARMSVVGLAMIVVGIGLFGVGPFFAGYATDSTSATAASGTALVFFAYEVIGLCAFVWFICRYAVGQSRHAAAIFLALLCLLVLTAMRGKRLELIIALIPLLLLSWATVLRRPWPRLAVILVLGLLIASMASLRFGELPTAMSLAFNAFSEGLYAGHVTPGIIDALSAGETRYEYGIRVVAALAAFIPRFVFPAKDELLYESLTDVSTFAPLGATSLLGEVYLQGGLLAVGIGFTLIGLLAGSLQVHRLYGRKGFISIRAVLYVLFISSFVLHFRDGLIPAIKIPLQLVVIFVVLMLVARVRPRLVRKAARADAPVGRWRAFGRPRSPVVLSRFA